MVIVYGYEVVTAPVVFKNTTVSASPTGSNELTEVVLLPRMLSVNPDAAVDGCV